MLFFLFFIFLKFIRKIEYVKIEKKNKIYTHRKLDNGISPKVWW